MSLGLGLILWLACFREVALGFGFDKRAEVRLAFFHRSENLLGGLRKLCSIFQPE